MTAARGTVRKHSRCIRFIAFDDEVRLLTYCLVHVSFCWPSNNLTCNLNSFYLAFSLPYVSNANPPPLLE